MDTTTIVLIVLLAVAVVAAIVTPIVTTLLSRARYEARTQRASLLNSEVTELRDQLTQARDSETAGKLEIERLKAENRAAEDKLKTLEKAEVNLKESFENLANRIFDSKQEKFSKDSSETLSNVLKPLKQDIEGFRKRADELHQENTKERTALRTQIDQIVKASSNISDEAQNLTKALTNDPGTRGRWGEMILESILTKSGLREGHEYKTQVSITTEDGTFRPDVIVHFPHERDVIIDSKVSLVDWYNFQSAESDAEREQSLKGLINAVKRNITELSKRNYQSLPDVRSLDMVLMFMPIESAYLAVNSADPGIFEEALEHRIAIVSPTLLMAVLQLANGLWKIDQRNRNADEIARQAGKIYDKCVNFIESFESVGKNLARAHDRWQDADKQLKTGRGNLMGATNKLKKLGVSTSKQLPDSTYPEIENGYAEDDETEDDS